MTTVELALMIPMLLLLGVLLAAALRVREVQPAQKNTLASGAPASGVGGKAVKSPSDEEERRRPWSQDAA